MLNTNKSQAVPEHLLIAARLKMLGKTQEYLAKRLKRSQTSISEALNGKNKKTLERIKTHVQYLERKGRKVKKFNAWVKR